MQFNIVDPEAAYRRLLNTPDAVQRQAIFQRELVEPFAGLVQFFGGDGLAVFGSWGMSPELFADDRREQMAAIIAALAASDAWNRAVKALEKGWAAFAAYADRIPLEAITFGLYVADMNSEHGYTGFGGIPGWIMTVYGVPDEYNLQRIEGATVHELHHNLGGAANPRNTNMMALTVGEYMIMEGLAESFAAELYGKDMVGPWVTEFDDSNLEHAKALFRDALNLTGFNTIRGYIFGDVSAERTGQPQAGVPAFAGYALGYRVVQTYLKRAGRSVVEATFVPAHEIIAQSAFFE
jgi:uncharacterized protein YjaZ